MVKSIVLLDAPSKELISFSKRVLYAYKQNTKRVLELESDLARLDGYHSVSMSLTVGTKGSGNIVSSTENVAIKREKISNEIGYIKVFLKVVERGLNQIDNLEKEIISKKYIAGKTWTYITAESTYSRSGLRKKARRSLEKLGYYFRTSGVDLIPGAKSWGVYIDSKDIINHGE